MQYCSIYDYELLEAFLDSVECQKAIELLDNFTKELYSSILIELDLLSDNEELPPFMPGTHTLVVKYGGEQSTMKIEKIIRKAIFSEFFQLKKGSLIFKGVQEGCVALIYQISSAVKCYLQQYHISDKHLKLLFKEYKIECLLIDDEELKGKLIK